MRMCFYSVFMFDILPCVFIHWWHALIAQRKSCSFNDAAQTELQKKRRRKAFCLIIPIVKSPDAFLNPNSTQGVEKK